MIAPVAKTNFVMVLVHANKLVETENVILPSAKTVQHVLLIVLVKRVKSATAVAVKLFAVTEHVIPPLERPALHVPQIVLVPRDNNATTVVVEMIVETIPAIQRRARTARLVRRIASANPPSNV